MSISINTAIPTCSRYVLFIDVPYRFSARHFSAAFDQSVPRPLADRVCHFVMGSLLLFPVINLVVAAVQCNFFGSSVSTPQKGATQQIIPPVIPSKNDTAQHMTPENRLKSSLSEGEKAWKSNPYIIANHEELRPSDDRCFAYISFNPFEESLKSGNLEVARQSIDDPYFKGFNRRYAVTVVGKSSPMQISWCPLAIAAYHKHTSIFKMLLDHPATHLEFCDYRNGDLSPLIVLCEHGAGREDFIEQLISKGASPFSRDLSGSRELSALTLATSAKVKGETLKKLAAWQDLNKAVDQRGNDALQHAVINGDLHAFENALKTGICINNRNWNGQTALFLAISNLGKFGCEENARAMIDKLLEKRAQLNIQNYHGLTPLLELVSKKPSGWEQLAIRLLEQGADPDISTYDQIAVSQLLRTYPSTHPVKDYLLKRPDTLTSYYQNQYNLATLLGSFVAMDKWELASGGNHSEVIYELLADVMDAFLKDPGIDEEMHELFSSAKEASFLAKEISFTSNLDDIMEKIRGASHPVLISSGWKGHAVSLTLYENRLICANVGARPPRTLAGLGRYELYRHLWAQTDFRSLIKYNMNPSNIEDGIDYYRRLEKLGCEHQSTIELPEQVIGNCTWASSALLGLRSVLEIQNKWESEKIAKAIDQFNQFAQSFLILKTLKHLQANISKLPLPLCSKCLSSCAHWLCKQLHEGKDAFGYYRKALDAITFSGFRLDDTRFLYEKPSIGFYAGLYSMTSEFFSESLLENPHRIGSWLPLL